MRRRSPSPLDADVEIRSYRDFRRVVRGHSAQSLHQLYDRGYFERQVADRDLADLYFESRGLAATRYTERPLELAQVRAADRVLDVGCGRGEVVFQAAARGAEAVGVDFSASAIDIAEETRTRHEPGLRDRVRFLVGNGERLPFAAGSFDKIFLLDVVEHLAPSELTNVLRECRRVLTPDGLLVVHTTENRWNNTVGHRLHSALRLVTGRRPLPPPAVAEYQRVRADPALDERKWFMHVNEQTVPGLKLALWRAGFSSRVWIGEHGDVWAEKPGAVNRLRHVAFRLGRLHLLFGNHIYAVANPRS